MALLQRLLRRKQQPTPSSKPPLTPARSLSWLLDAAVQRARAGQALLCLLGVLGLALLPLLERRIEFDENALLAGSARPTISYAVPSALDAGRAFADGLRPTFFSFAFSTALQAALSAGGLEVSNHTFSSSGSGGSLSCVNVHAVVRSPRGDGKEALVLVTPINHQHIATDFQQDGSGVALSLALGYALAAHLGSAASPWLAKELIWLLPDASCGLVTALDAWTHTYQLQPLRDAGSSPHFVRAGVLQQALLLEAPSGSFNALQVSLEGAAGQLPKLDMFWLFRWYCQAYVSAPVELPQQPHGSGLAAPLRSLRALLAPLVLPLLPLPAHEAEAALDGHLLKLQALVAFMRRQARGLPTGGHAAFKGLGVDAATLRLLRRGADGQLDGPVGFTGAGNADGAGSAEALGDAAAIEAAVQRLLAEQQQQQQDDTLQGDEHLVGFDMALLQLGNVFEAALRSCSGLIERFHHSLFLYVLTSLGTYVSVERYIGPLVALIAALLLQAAYLARNATEQDAERAAFKEAAAAAAAGTRGSSSKAAGSDSSSGTKLNPLVEAHRLRVPASQEAAAAQRSEWVGALQLVAACHAAAVSAASLARSAASAAAAAAGAGPLQQSLAALQRSLEAAEGSSPQQQWLGRLAAAPQQHGWELGLGAGLLVSLALACEGLLSTSAAGAPPPCSSRSRRQWVSVRKVLVVELSVAAAVLAAIACVNWALGYVLCLLLVPLSLTATRQDKKPASSAARAMRASVALCCSPLGALLLLSAATPGIGLRGALRPSWLQWLVTGSSRGTYLVACGLYLPCWLLTVWAWLA